MAIGQGELLLTPIQMANIASIIANKGFYYTPHIIKSIEGENNIDSSFTEKKYTTISKKNYDLIIEGMEKVIKNSNVISNEVVKSALNSQKIDDKGLDETDRKFMKFLFNNNGPIGLESIAAALGEDVSMLEFVVEPYLIQLGFISRTPRGRKLSSTGYRYCDELGKNT